jgi:hypothetical protein
LLLGLPSKFYKLIYKLNERTSMVTTTSLNFSEWVNVFGEAKMATEFLDWLNVRCNCHSLSV